MIFQKRRLGYALIVLASVTSSGCIGEMTTLLAGIRSSVRLSPCLPADETIECEFTSGEDPIGE